MADLRPLFVKNAALFRQKHLVIGRDTLDEAFASLGEAELADLTLGVETGKWLYLGKLMHSERNAEREAQRAAENLSGAQALVAVSTGAGFLFGQLNRALGETLLIEPSAYCLVAFILAGKFTDYGGKITLFADDLSRSDALEEILPWLQGKNLKKTLIYCHPPVFVAGKALYTRAFERVTALFEKRSVNQATIVKFQQLWNKNILLNSRIIRRSATLNDLLQQTPPAAIVLAGAGPSLTQSIPDLIALRDRFVLFAADTALIPLNRAGVFPDFVFSADPQWVNHFFVQSPYAARSQWLMDPVVCPAIPHFLAERGAVTAFWNNVFLSDTAFRSVDRGDVAHGGSVSTNAFDIAVRWLLRRDATTEPGRLILVGQDLSFPNRQAHCAGAALESAVFAGNHRLSTMEKHNYRQMTAMPVLWEKGIRDKVRTNGKLRIFLDWFASRAADHAQDRITLINASVDGVLIRGFRHTGLGEALSGLPAKQQTAWLVAPTSGTTDGKTRPLMADLDELVKISAENARLAANKSPDQALRQRLDRNDEKLRNLGLAKDIAGLNAQAIILKITEQGEDSDAVQFYAAMARAGREVRHWLGKAL
ncbi:MAG: 6-hydroxymethylpterin diphosphokinase MptE-like protein [Turneriella sp.]